MGFSHLSPASLALYRPQTFNLVTLQEPSKRVFSKQDQMFMTGPALALVFVLQSKLAPVPESLLHLSRL